MADDEPQLGGAGEAARTQAVRNKGRPDGLFRGCMDEIKRAHSVGNALRGAMLIAGLLTDKACYTELLAQFFLATRALEARVAKLEAGGGAGTGGGEGEGKGSGGGGGGGGGDPLPLMRPILDLGIGFTEGYAKDLEHLCGGEGWEARVDAMATEPAKQYVR